MKKIKITETQALKLKEMLNKPTKPKKVKVTHEQYKKILEYELNEGMTPDDILKSFERQLSQKPTSKPSPEQISKKLETLKKSEEERDKKEKEDFDKLIKGETDEEITNEVTGAASSGFYVGPLFKTKIIKKK